MVFAPNAATVFADGPLAAPHRPDKVEIRRLFAQYEAAIDAFGSGAGSIAKATKALLLADLAHDADVMAWVYNDTTVSNNGIYKKSGASGAGSWTLILPLPYSFIVASNAGAGTANAIQATTPVPVSTSAIILLNITATNTASPVTVQLNGGTTYTIKTNSGNDVVAGGLIANMLLLGVISGSTFRLISDQASAAIVAAAEDAAERAEAAASSVVDSIAFVGSFGKSLDADGVTNDVPGLLALEGSAEEVIRLKNATYFIGSNYTPTKTLRFSSGTKFLIAEGVTVDFSEAEPEIHAPKKQRFYFAGAGTGSVSGFYRACIGWFAGDKLGTTADARSEVQKCADSLVSGGEIRWPREALALTGETYVEMTKGQKIIGQNRMSGGVLFTTEATFGFRWTSAHGGGVKDIGARKANSLIAPSGGVVFYFESGRYWSADRIFTDSVFRPVYAKDGFGSIVDPNLNNSRANGVMIEQCNEVQVVGGRFAANSSWAVLTGIAGAFAASETITWAGGSEGTIFTDGSANCKVIFNNYTLSTGTVITGATSGATATVSEIINGHVIGGLRLYNRCDATLLSMVEVSGGNYGLVIDHVSGGGVGSASLSTIISGCLFDSVKIAAASVEDASLTHFDHCWFSSFAGCEQDVYLVGVRTAMLDFCTWMSTNKRCVTVGGSSKNVQINGGVMGNLNKQNVAALPAIHYQANTSGSVRDVQIGVDYGYSTLNNPQVGVQIEAGADVLIENVDVSLCANAPKIVDNSGGTARIRNCKGYKTKASGAATMPTSGSVVINHGLGKAPTKVIITPQADPQVRFFAPPANYTATTFTVACNASPASAFNFAWEASTYHD